MGEVEGNWVSSVSHFIKEIDYNGKKKEKERKEKEKEEKSSIIW